MVWPMYVLTAQDRGEDVVRVDTELASFEVSVTDKRGNPVRNLDAKNFRVFEDGIERPVEFFQPIRKEETSRPLSVVFALDVSGSMTPQELERLRSAMATFIKRLSEYNSYYAVVSFGMDVKTIQSFTPRPERLDKTFSKLLRDDQGLSTHAYDAVDGAIRLLRKKSPPVVRERIPKRAVILITDGFPVGDIVSPKTVIERANAFETSIYSVILPSFSRLQKSDKPLLTPLEASGLIEKTGGRSFYATAKNFDDLFRSLAEEITSSYALAFYPNEQKRSDGRFHEVRIEATGDLVVRQNRNGYKMQ